MSVRPSLSCNLLYISQISCSSSVSYESSNLRLHPCSFRSRRPLVERSPVFLPLGLSRLGHRPPLSSVRHSSVRRLPVPVLRLAFARPIAAGLCSVCSAASVRWFSILLVPLSAAFAGSASGAFLSPRSRRSLVHRSARSSALCPRRSRIQRLPVPVPHSAVQCPPVSVLRLSLARPAFGRFLPRSGICPFDVRPPLSSVRHSSGRRLPVLAACSASACPAFGCSLYSLAASACRSVRPFLVVSLLVHLSRCYLESLPADGRRYSKRLGSARTCLASRGTV